MTRRRLAGEQAFTLIEILVASTILLILIGVSGFLVSRSVARARVVGARSQVEAFSLALTAYFGDTGRYPTSEQGLRSLWEKPTLAPVPRDWQGPYLQKAVPVDAWGSEYLYSAPGPHGLPYGIRSLGADGVEGDADILS